MTQDDAAHRAHEDLAFMRGLVTAKDNAQLAIGESYVAAGAIYGLQCLYHWSQVVEAWRTGPTLSLAIVAGFTIVFVVLLTLILRRHGGGSATGATARAGGAVFGAIGLSNLVLIAIFAVVAVREQSLTIWLLYSVVVLVQQGAGWLAYFMLRRIAWMLASAVGFFACAIAMAIMTGTAGYLGVLTFALLVIMTGSGLLLIREARRDA